MPRTYQHLCRSCEIEFVLVSEETGDVECPSCRVWLEGGVFAAFLNYEHRKVVSEAIAEIRTLSSGKTTAVPRRDLIEHLRNIVLTVEVPDDKGPSD